MSETDPRSLTIVVQGEGTTASERRRTWLRVLSAGLRRVASPAHAVADGTPVLSASIRYRLLDEYFPWTAPVQGTVAFRVNLDRVVSIRVRRESLMGWPRFWRKDALNVFPRNEESDHPLDFMWLGVTAHLIVILARDALLRLWEWYYLRYGGPMPPVPGPLSHALHRLARPVTGDIEIDIQQDERLHFEAVLASWEIFHATVEARMPAATYEMRAHPRQSAMRIAISVDSAPLKQVMLAPLDATAGKLRPPRLLDKDPLRLKVPQPLMISSRGRGKGDGTFPKGPSLARIPIESRPAELGIIRYWKARIGAAVYMSMKRSIT